MKDIWDLIPLYRRTRGDILMRWLSKQHKDETNSKGQAVELQVMSHIK